MKEPIFGGKNTTFHPKHKEKNTKKRKNAGIKAFFIKIMSTFAAQNEPTI